MANHSTMQRIAQRHGLAVVAAFIAVTGLSACQTTGNSLPEPAAMPAPTPQQQPQPNELMAAAEAALAEGRLEYAHLKFLQALSISPDNVNAKLGIAEVYLAARESVKAEAAFRDLANIAEIRSSALQGQGLALLMSGDAEAARRSLEESAKADPSSWRTWNGLGQAYDRLRQWKQAERSYRKALELSSEKADVHNNLGYSYLLQHRFEEAENQFLAALSARPKFDLAIANLRITLAWQGKYLEALAGVTTHEQPKVLNNIGFVAMLRGDYDRAEAYLIRAMETSASFYDVAWRNLKALEAMTPQTGELPISGSQGRRS